MHGLQATGACAVEPALSEVRGAMTPFLLIYAAVGIVVAVVMLGSADTDASGHWPIDVLGAMFVGALWLPMMVAMAGSWIDDVVTPRRR